jgi:hypothetical protein
MIKISTSVRALLASLPALAVALSPATVVATPAAASSGALADLEFAWRPESTDVSYLGGMGARALVQAVATNVGTRAASRVTFHFTPPPGSTMDPAENEQAATKTPEEGTENNIASGGTAYFAAGTMSGRAWLDNDRDGTWRTSI